MSDITSICGQVQGLTPKLLQRAQIDRMVGAPKAEDAFRVLGELQYADYLDQQTEITDFDSIITQGLFETKQLLISGVNEHPVALFLTLPFDVNNLKQALKQKLVEENSDLKVGESFSKLGQLSAAEVKKIVFDNVQAGNISAVILNAVREVIANFNKEESVRDIEFALDRAMFAALEEELSTQSYPDYFLPSYLELWADSVQVRNLARSVLVIKEPLPEKAFVPVSSITVEMAGKAESLADLKRVLERTPFNVVIGSLDDNSSATVQLLALEHALDKKHDEFLHNAALGSLDSPAILLDYFNKRLQNARILKLVMYGKLNGVEVDKIYKLIETV
ncbi:V-type ATPase subunit [bacterium]|nr:V-type ATPase subunit [bacterium]NCQ55443.1 V-type ATPase subunit [Candidatus Parcubacteria bacterium]NCS67805.1 V-type ATPase subunit [Candidatus Peregrinibacteria bacterium]NCS96381.1 V-type ATPase subunit [bacterium]